MNKNFKKHHKNWATLCFLFVSKKILFFIKWCKIEEHFKNQNSNEKPTITNSGPKKIEVPRMKRVTDFIKKTKHNRQEREEKANHIMQQRKIESMFSNNWIKIPIGNMYQNGQIPKSTEHVAVRKI